ncbi:MAG: hypothetical protein H6Q73_150 [Firmicutes bacterium]|nr:hypothetical protein [Bacillota bacterium]
MADKSRQSSGSSTKTSQGVTVATGTGTTESAELLCGCPEPGPETIEVEQVLGMDMAQRVLEFDMVVPDPKPSIEQIIDVYVKDLEITKVDVIPNKVIIRGDLAVKVMYVADLPNQPVHAFERDKIRWTRDIEIYGAAPNMKATADAVVEYVNYDFDESKPRQLYITIVLKVWTRVVTTTEMDVYALTPVDQVGEAEFTTASASQNLTSGPSSASQYAEANVIVSGPGITPIAGTSLEVSGTATVTGNKVNVRSGPGTNFPVVVQVNKGEVVTLKDQAFGWNKVVLSDGNTVGWIAGWLLSSSTSKAKG